MPQISVRPGWVIRDVLSGKQAILSPVPLKDRLDAATTAVSEGTRTRASVGELHRTYRALIYDENLNREGKGRERKLHSMTYTSFALYVNKAKRLGLVRPVAEEPMNFPPDQKTLYSVRLDAQGRPLAVASAIVYYELTARGTSAAYEWDNLAAAYAEAPRLYQEQGPALPAARKKKRQE